MNTPPAPTFQFLPMLCLLFIGLKLSGHIDWSWWWVMSPMLIPIALLLVLGACLLLLK